MSFVQCHYTTCVADNTRSAATAGARIPFLSTVCVHALFSTLALFSSCDEKRKGEY